MITKRAISSNHLQVTNINKMNTQLNDKKFLKLNKILTGLKSFRDCLFRAVIAYGSGGEAQPPPPPPPQKKNSVKNP